MTNIYKKLKFYHILILGVILFPTIIINSNYVNKQRAEEKLYKEKSRLFNKIILGRNLEGEPDPPDPDPEEPAVNPEKTKEKEDSKSKVDEVCERGSDELKKYYKTGNLEEINLKNEKITCEDKDKDYIKGLINIIKSQMKGDKKDKQETEEENNGRRNLSNEEEKDEKEDKSEDDDLTNNVMAYGKHLLPVLIFLVVAILCIPGWLMCCFCCCCNCCCCCCCKKPCCKIPCFVITYGLYALVVAVCFYGLSQSNHIFIGIADTECSILRFVDEIIDGESKETLPKWAGLNGIKGILVDIRTTINNMGTQTVTDLNNEIKEIDGNDHGKIGKKKEFLDNLKEIGTKFYEKDGSYHNDYTIEYPYDSGQSINGKFVLDIVEKFGKYLPASENSEEKGDPEESFTKAWVTEYKLVAQTADSQMNTAKESFESVLGDKLGDITDALDKGINSMENIDSSVGDVKGSLSDAIADNAGIIDEYGKLGVKAVFGILALIDIAIAAFMLLICLCSGKCCTKCCCCRCICKLFTHLLWNILALLMIIVFLLGSLFALIGKVGEDAMSIISFLVSDDNLGEDKETILLTEVKDYLAVCINGNGNLEDKLGFDKSAMNHLDDIKYAQNNITYAKNQFESKLQMFTYSNTIRELEERRNLQSSTFSLVREDDISASPLNLAVLLGLINENPYTKDKKEKWTLDCESHHGCNSNSNDDGIDSPHDEICFQPKNCLPSYRDWIQETGTPDDIKKKAQIIADMKDIIDIAFTKSAAGTYKYFNESLGDLGNKYFAFLNQYILALTEFNNTIDSITADLNKYTGEDAGIFSLINCKFISKNIKVMLKYLKEALGGDVYTIGICLILVGCSLALSISFTILLIIVINADIDNNKKKNNVPEYALNSGGRVIQYK